VTLSAAMEIVLDHAKSEARRGSCELILAVHLVAGLRRWREEQFDQRYPGIDAGLVKALTDARGNSVSTPKLDSSLGEHVERVESMDDLWTLVDRLVDDCQLRTLSTSSVGLTPKVVSQSDSRSSNKEPLRDPDVGDDVPLGAVDGLADRLHELTGRSRQDVLGIMLRDIAWIHASVTGERDLNRIVELLSRSHSDLPSIEIPDDLSDFVLEVNNSTVANAKKLASQVAFYYADVAEWFASIDNRFDEAEIDRIDALKERLIAQLGGTVDTDVGATQNFEAKFSNLIGMQTVKSQIRKFVDTMVVQRRRQKRGLPVAPQRMHLAFLGNPGTGKTTVARLYGELLHELGLMNTTKFVEVAGTDFTAYKYLGESETAMNRSIDEAMNGILFIDEAYAMNDPYNSDDKRGPGLKATDVLVKKMEDYRDRFCVILAGYTDITNDYLKANPGMPSRIGATIEFPDYNAEEIRQMVPLIASRRGLALEDGVLDRICDAVEASRNRENFGNARSVEKVIEEAERNCIARVAELGALATDKQLKTLKVGDIPNVAPAYRRQIGFASGNSPGYL